MPTGHSTETDRALPPDFGERLERSLGAADGERRRRVWLRRARQILPVALLVGPLLAWRLTLSTPDGVHVVIAALAQVTFALDLAVHVDSSILSYLGLSQLPSIVGILLTIVLTASLLAESRGQK